MKKLIYILLATILLSSCDDYLNTDSLSKLEEDKIYPSIYYTQSVVMGIYDDLANANMYGARLSINWVTNSDIEFAGADQNTYNQNTNRGVSNYYATPNNSTLNINKIYEMIELANKAERGIKNSPLTTSGTTDQQAAMKAMLGEVKTMRALGYFELVRNWGDMPFKTEPTKSDLSNAYIPKTNRDSICDFLIRDLEQAQEDVPWIGGSAGSISYTSSERITKGFIKGLIARISLARGGYSLRDKPGYPMERGTDWQKYYKIANEQCLDIINAGKYKLKPDYINIWKDVCRLQADGVYGENLYEVAFGLAQSGEIGYSIGIRFYANTKYGFSNNANTVNTSAYYYYSFDKEDLRKNVSAAFVMYSNTSGALKEIFQSNPMSYNIGKWDQRWMSENPQWLAQNLAANNKWGYGVNWILMRYSDVLLMYAETENELNGGPTANAKKALKEVRTRAFAGTASEANNVEAYVNKLGSKEQFFDALVNERAWEFGGEGIRKYDLIRWNMLSIKIQAQRDALNAMIDGGTAKVFDKQYQSLPKSIYYKYATDKENILVNDVNFYETRPNLDALSSKELSAKGYTKVKWMTDFTDDNKRNYKDRIKFFSSGLQQVYNGVCDNRYLFPIPSSIISDYQGIISNSYGY